MGGLRWHAVCVGRLLRSTEGVGAESHTVAKVAQGGMFEESRGRGVAALCAGKQAGRWWRGTNGAARFTRADATCDETMEVWQHLVGWCRVVSWWQAGTP